MECKYQTMVVKDGEKIISGESRWPNMLNIIFDDPIEVLELAESLTRMAKNRIVQERYNQELRSDITFTLVGKITDEEE